MYINKALRSAGKSVRSQVASSANDGYWYPVLDTFVSNAASVSYGVNTGYLVHAYVLWGGITIPAGVTIQEAIVEYYLESYTGTPAGEIYFNDTATPTAPTTASGAEAKTLTTAHVTLNPALSAGWKQINVTTIINELLASYTSYSYGSMMAILRGSGSGTNTLGLRAYDYSGNLHGAILKIRWY